MIRQFPVYLFDVDGTLLDSAADICGAIQSILGPEAAVTDEFLRGYIGRHLYDLFRDLFPDRTREHMDAMIADYRTRYLARCHTSTRPYPGIAEALAALPGKKSTATTKGTPTTRAVLEMFGLPAKEGQVAGLQNPVNGLRASKILLRANSQPDPWK